MTITQKHVFKAQTKRVNANTDATQSKGLRHINVVQKAMQNDATSRTCTTFLNIKNAISGRD